MRDFLKKDRGLFALSEARFCNRKEAEHIMLLKAFAPLLTVSQAEILNEHKEKSDEIYKHLYRFCEILSNKQNEISPEEEEAIRETLEYCRRQSKKLQEYLAEIKTNNENIAIMVEHFRRELHTEERPVGRYF